MTILHDEHKPKATPMTSDAVVDLVAATMRGRDWPEIPEGLRDGYRLEARKVLSALSDAGLALRPHSPTVDMMTAAENIDERAQAEGRDGASFAEIWGAMAGAFHSSRLETKR